MFFIPLVAVDFCASFRDEMRIVTDFRTSATSFILALGKREKRRREGGRERRR